MQTRSGRGWIRWALWVVLSAQILLTGLYLYELLSSHLSLRSGPLSWEMRELLELAAALGLLLGLSLGIVALQRTRQNLAELESRMRVASSAFYDLVEDEFKTWGLSPREHEIGLFMLKGLSNAEICDVTGKAEGTIKAQSNSLFRKAGLANRTQLLGYFVEVLMQEPLMGQQTQKTPIEVDKSA